MIETQVETPCGVADVAFIDPTEPVKVVPILRAGLVLIENSTTLLPAMQTYHLGKHPHSGNCSCSLPPPLGNFSCLELGFLSFMKQGVYLPINALEVKDSV